MIDTVEYYAGTYPEPQEVIDDDEYGDDELFDDFNLNYADEYHELEVIGELENE